MQQCVYGTRICDICDLQKCLTQTWVDFEQNVIEAAIDQWRDSLRSCMCAGGAHFVHTEKCAHCTCCEIIVYLYYVVHQNILWNWQCNLVHLTAIL